MKNLAPYLQRITLKNQFDPGLNCALNTNFHGPNSNTFLFIYVSIHCIVLSGHSKRRLKIGFQDRFLLNACQKYCRMLQGEHSAILSTFIKLPFVIKILVLSIFEWQLKTGFTVRNLNSFHHYNSQNFCHIKI